MKIIRILIPVLLLFVACQEDPVITVDPSTDTSPPKVTLAVTYLDPNTGESNTVTTWGDNPLGNGSSQSITVDPGGYVLAYATAEDVSGVKTVKVWNIGTDLYDMEDSEYINQNPGNAYQKVIRGSHFTPEPGQRVELFANATNFGGGAFGTTLATTKSIHIEVNGTPPGIPAGAQSRTIQLYYDNQTKFYTSIPGDKPFGNVNIVGVEITNTFNAAYGTVYFGPEGDPDLLDVRKDFFRFHNGEWVDFFNGPWPNETWHGLKGIRPASQNGSFYLKVHYQAN